MKASILGYLVALSCATATPVSQRTTPTDVEPYLERKQVAIKVDCNVLINQFLLGIDSYPNFGAQIVAVGKYAGIPGATAYSVCRAFKNQDVIDCQSAGLAVAGGLYSALVFGFLDSLHEDGAQTVTPENSQAHHQRSVLLHEHLGNHLRSKGADFEYISVEPTVDRRDDYGDSDNSTADGHVIEVRGLREPGHDFSSDLRISSRDDGTGHVHTMPRTVDHLGRRAGGTGYKITWKASI
ncbi:hypothetical protein GGS26DRAFT_594001 [Hypomontagnella submonticulosa]|nr:hypothetical protein GGS26DRAFT_594001 [Hypomontagnella submonticulosa]